MKLNHLTTPNTTDNYKLAIIIIIIIIIIIKFLRPNMNEFVSFDQQQTKKPLF